MVDDIEVKLIKSAFSFFSTLFQYLEVYLKHNGLAFNQQKVC